MNRRLFARALVLFLISFVDGKPSRKQSADKHGLNACTSGGGSCVRQRNCGGWVDSENGWSCASNTVCCKPVPVTSNPEPAATGDATCGQVTRLSTHNPLLRIVGGSDAEEGESPWQVAFVDLSGDHFCGGTLISDQHVVTAAHCFQSQTATTSMVILGEHHMEYDTGNELTMAISQIVLHEGYSDNGHPYDIALVKLSTPVDITGHYVRTACLPSPDSVWTSQDSCFASGWGYTSGTNDRRYLQHVDVTLVDNTNCRALWGDGVVIGEDHVCAGMGTTGTCQGDSGGPLVCQRDGKYVLAGVTSWGHLTCTATGYPDVYTRVSSYRDWLQEHMVN